MEQDSYVCFVFGCLLLFSSRNSEVNGEKILMLSFFSSQSYKNVYDPLVKALATRGHEITIVSPLKSAVPAGKNVREIIGKTFPEILKAEGDPGLFPKNPFDTRLENGFMHAMSLTFLNIFVKVCQNYYEMEEVKGLLKEKFDLVITISFMNECTYGLVHKLNTSVIFAHPHGPEPWKVAFTGVPVPPSFVPMLYHGGTDRMSFYRRIINFVNQVGNSIWYYYVYTPTLEKVYRKYLGDEIPSIPEIERKASLIFMNRHFSVTFPRPQMPQMVEIAGMHCRPGEPLTKDIQDFIESSGPDGFIYFSLGSIVQMNTMPDHIRKIFLTVFGKLKQKVIWKWESETIEDLPKNILLKKWLPQQDILANPKIRMFITHGGMLSTEEAIYHGVPLLGIPLYGDQDWNVKISQERGIAISLELRELTEEKLAESINKILKESRFSENVRQLSSIFKDRPQKPLDLAVYWTEYVLRHKGAPHLQSPGADLNFIQYFSIDVLAFLLLIIWVSLYILFITCRAICCRKGTKKQNITTSKAKKVK